MSDAALNARMGESILHPNSALLVTITGDGTVADTITQLN